MLGGRPDHPRLPPTTTAVEPLNRLAGVSPWFARSRIVRTASIPSTKTIPPTELSQSDLVIFIAIIPQRDRLAFRLGERIVAAGEVLASFYRPDLVLGSAVYVTAHP